MLSAGAVLAGESVGDTAILFKVSSKTRSLRNETFSHTRLRAFHIKKYPVSSRALLPGINRVMAVLPYYRKGGA
ncbi:MAG: hypothetical protein CSA26_01480 [Desulfobacterales bacterium]|nr:MAG: hypothetical protein CSA26_01480 [Desulfobacterales bacterium]